ncbi:MAG: integrase arm-type DNA-binding domain-containing protein [Xanthobacteraceae bacterium]
MAKTVGRLTALRVARELPAGMYPDGDGLYLHVSTAGAKSWIYRYTLRKRPREMGLGPLSALTLADARTKAAECRALRQEGLDPIEVRKARHAQAALEEAKAITFKEAAEQYIKSHRAEWKNEKHASQWDNTLTAYVYPAIGSLSVQAIDTGLVRKVLEPIWTTKNETASRVRARLEKILDWAAYRGLRAGENPARWRGHLEFDLAARSKLQSVKHHAALPYAELPGFMAKLREQDCIAARALEFTIVTAARTSETIGAKPDEVSKGEKVWTVPAGRMKAGKEHRVPLSPRALTIVRATTAVQTPDDAFIFPGGKRGRPLSNMAMDALLRRMGYKDGRATVHGFRSTFRDWAAERTNFPNHVVEMALAHAVGDKVEAAYRRGDLFEKRRRLMADWATYCNTPKTERGTVVPIRGEAA